MCSPSIPHSLVLNALEKGYRPRAKQRNKINEQTDNIIRYYNLLKFIIYFIRCVIYFIILYILCIL